jgi:hypothetical protein
MRPHHVRMVVPEIGFGQQLDDMIAFARDHDCDLRSGGEERTADAVRHITWCFDDAITADAFRELFGGERRNVSPG